MNPPPSPSFDSDRGELTRPPAPIRVGISACLLGQKVRYDGGHKHDRYLTDTLGAHFEWAPVCPEVEIGMGIPREPIQLVQIGNNVRLVSAKGTTDYTEAMKSYAGKRVAELMQQGLSGYIFKKDSPSCGLERVRVYDRKGHATRSGRGLFASVLTEQWPNLPVEEEGRLFDPRLRENWIERVFAYHRLRGLWSSRWTIGKLVEFHTAYKLVLLAHSPAAYQQLGRLVSNAKSIPRAELRERYEQDFMGALKQVATRGRHLNVLQHMIGYFREHLDTASRDELAECLQDYRAGLVPLIVPITLVAHYVRLLGVTYLRDQAYLRPHPKELALRNHV